ncbi:MAG: flagellin [Bacteroidota bacterium]
MISSRIARQESLYVSYANSAIPGIRRDLAGFQEQLITGRRVNRPSDDPVAFAQARMLESLDERYAQYGRTIDSSRLWVNRTSDELSNLTERFAEAYEEGLQALNDTLNEGDREAIAGRVEALLDEVIDGLNAQSGSEYLFAGTRTTTAPFDEDGAPTGDLSGARNRQIGPNTELAINISGEQVLDPGEGFTIVESLQNLADALRGADIGVPGDEPSDLAEAVGQVGTARDHLIDLGAALGATARRLTTAEYQLQNASIETERRRSELEDADYFETVTAFQQAQTTLEAALATTASITQTTLLDYLR